MGSRTEKKVGRGGPGRRWDKEEGGRRGTGRRWGVVSAGRREGARKALGERGGCHNVLTPWL